MRSRLLDRSHFLFLARVASAACPGPDCIAGGGPAATDCIVTWSGIPPPSPPASTAPPAIRTAPPTASARSRSRPVSAPTPPAGSPGVDERAGDAGEAERAPPRSRARSRRSPRASARRRASRCPVKRSAGLATDQAGRRAARSRWWSRTASRIPTSSKLTCQPAAPSFANDVQPILTQRCTAGRLPRRHVRAPGARSVGGRRVRRSRPQARPSFGVKLIARRSRQHRARASSHRRSPARVSSRRTVR